MKQISGKEFAKILENHGWYLSRVKGSHHIYINSENNQIISLPIHGNKPLRPGILKGMMRLSGLSEEDLSIFQKCFLTFLWIDLFTKITAPTLSFQRKACPREDGGWNPVLYNLSNRKLGDIIETCFGIIYFGLV